MAYVGLTIDGQQAAHEQHGDDHHGGTDRGQGHLQKAGEKGVAAYVENATGVLFIRGRGPIVAPIGDDDLMSGQGFFLKTAQLP